MRLFRFLCRPNERIGNDRSGLPLLLSVSMVSTEFRSNRKVQMNSFLPKSLVFTLVISAALASNAIAQVPYQARIKHQKQGTYSGLRFIYIDYRGPLDSRLWQDAFNKACAQYSRQDVSHRKGGDHDFFRIRGLSKNRQVILGFYDEKTKKSGFMVVGRITSSQVLYSINGREERKNGKNPGKFEKWYINTVDTGGNLATGDSGYWDRSAAIQIWKDDNETDACAAFWIL